MSFASDQTARVAARNAVNGTYIPAIDTALNTVTTNIANILASAMDVGTGPSATAVGPNGELAPNAVGAYAKDVIARWLNDRLGAVLTNSGFSGAGTMRSATLASVLNPPAV